MQERSSAIAARQTANARERERLEAAASTVALDFDALDSLPWMPKVAARSAAGGAESGPPLRNVYTTSTDSDTMDFKPRPPKLGIGAKAQPSDVTAAADDTGLRKVLRKEMHKTQRAQRQAGAAGGASSDEEDSQSDSHSDDGVSRTNAARRRR